MSQSERDGSDGCYQRCHEIDERAFGDGAIVHAWDEISIGSPGPQAQLVDQ
jgi:hypothetical protein